MLFFTQIESSFRNKRFRRSKSTIVLLTLCCLFAFFPIVFRYKSFPYAFHKVETAQTLLANKCVRFSLFFWHRFLSKDAILLFKSNLNCFVSTLPDVFMLRALSKNVYWKTCNKQQRKYFFIINIFVSHLRSSRNL